MSSQPNQPNQGDTFNPICERCSHRADLHKVSYGFNPGVVNWCPCRAQVSYDTGIGLCPCMSFKGPRTEEEASSYSPSILTPRAQEIYDTLKDKGIVSLGRSVKTAMADEFMGQIQHDLTTPRPPCANCGHSYDLHVTVGLGVGPCLLSVPFEPCDCKMYEPKSYDIEPTPPDKEEDPDRGDPFDDLLDAVRDIIHKYGLDRQGSVDVVRQFSALYSGAFGDPKRTHIWQGWRRR